jgi:hypothetical protein
MSQVTQVAYIDSPPIATGISNTGKALSGVGGSPMLARRPCGGGIFDEGKPSDLTK